MLHFTSCVQNADRCKLSKLNPEFTRVLFSEEDKKQEKEQIAEKSKFQRLKEEVRKKELLEVVTLFSCLTIVGC